MSNVELLKFKRPVLEVLYQLPEEGCIVISRARFRVEYPAHAMLVASMNTTACVPLTDSMYGCVCALSSPVSTHPSRRARSPGSG